MTRYRLSQPSHRRSQAYWTAEAAVNLQGCSQKAHAGGAPRGGTLTALAAPQHPLTPCSRESPPGAAPWNEARRGVTSAVHHFDAPPVGLSGPLWWAPPGVGSKPPPGL